MLGEYTNKKMAAASSCQLQNNTMIQTRCYPSSMLCIRLWCAVSSTELCQSITVLTLCSATSAPIQLHPQTRRSKFPQMFDPQSSAVLINFLVKLETWRIPCGNEKSLLHFIGCEFFVSFKNWKFGINFTYNVWSVPAKIILLIIKRNFFVDIFSN